MTTIESVANIIGMAIGAVGLLFILNCIIDLVFLSSATKVQGKVIDHVQEYTSRGFLWKSKVSYVHNDKQYVYVLRARTRTRGTEDIELRVTKRGRIIEINHIVEKFVLGLIAIAIWVILAHCI